MLQPVEKLRWEMNLNVIRRNCIETMNAVTFFIERLGDFARSKINDESGWEISFMLIL
jgi:hypothetical protein